MKKIMPLFLTIAMLLSLGACGAQTNLTGSASLMENEVSSVNISVIPSFEISETPGNELPAPSNLSDSKELVVYFSLPETTDPSNMTTEEANSTVIIDGVVLGNTQYIANLIQEHTNADIFRIEPVNPYPTDHETLVNLASEEKANSARPAINATIDNLDQYGTVFIGYPNWWGDMPMILYTFLESYDLSGKIIIPFNTHGGSGFSNSISTIERLQPNATVDTDGYSVSRNDVQEAAPDVTAWLDELGYAPA